MNKAYCPYCGIVLRLAEVLPDEENEGVYLCPYCDNVVDMPEGQGT